MLASFTSTCSYVRTHPWLPTSHFFFFNDPPPPEIYTLPLHDALPIYLEHLAEVERRLVGDVERLPRRALLAEEEHRRARHVLAVRPVAHRAAAQPRDLVEEERQHRRQDRKSTRLNSSHSQISYAVFCL